MDTKLATNRKPPNNGMGRPKGIPNKATKDVKEAIARFAEGNVHKLEEWLETIAYGDGDLVKPDPAKAADLYMKVIEYHIPKLARQEVVGDKENPVEIAVSMRPKMTREEWLASLAQ
jgi:hypothetical protein